MRLLRLIVVIADGEQELARPHANMLTPYITVEGLQETGLICSGVAAEFKNYSITAAASPPDSPLR